MSKTIYDSITRGSEPNEAQAATVELFASKLEECEPEWSVLSIDIAACLVDEVIVTLRTRHNERHCDKRCYIFFIGKRGGAYCTRDGGGKRYLKPHTYGTARLY